MLEQGKITAVDHGVAVATPIELDITPSLQGCAGTSFATYFCDYVSHLILNNEAFGSTLEERERLLYRGGLTITTTLDSRLQNLAQQQVDASAGANPDKWGAAMTTVQPGTGEDPAMAQNTVFVPPQEGKYDTQLNFNVDAKDENGYDLNGAGGFQPGSTMKPFIYAEWLNEGKHPPTATVDASRRVYPVGFPPWRSSCGKVLGGYSTAQKAQNLGADDDLQNNDDGYYRPMPINYGLYNSINTATFATAAQLDFCGIQKMVDAVGLHSGLDNAPVNMHQIGNLLGSIGVAPPMVLASAYATFANDGTYCKPIAITGISDSQGRQFEAQTPECREAVKPAVARGVNSVLQDVMKVGSGVWIEPKVHTKVPRGRKDGDVQQQRSYVGGRLHHDPRYGVVLWRYDGGTAAGGAERHHQRQVLQIFGRVHDRRSAMGQLHGGSCGPLPERAVRGTGSAALPRSNHTGDAAADPTVTPHHPRCEARSTRYPFAKGCKAGPPTTNHHPRCEA